MLVLCLLISLDFSLLAKIMNEKGNNCQTWIFSVMYVLSIDVLCDSSPISQLLIYQSMYFFSALVIAFASVASCHSFPKISSFQMDRVIANWLFWHLISTGRKKVSIFYSIFSSLCWWLMLPWDLWRCQKTHSQRGRPQQKQPIH